MPRKNKSFLGRRSGALDVQGEVCLDNPGVVIDRMTRREGVLRAPRLRPVQLRGPIPGVRSHALRASVTDMVYVQTADPRRVFEANVDGSESRALMSLPGDLGSSFAVSPDGKRIRFATADSKMWESNLDGSGMHRLFPEHNNDSVAEDGAQTAGCFCLRVKTEAGPTSGRLWKQVTVPGRNQ